MADRQATFSTSNEDHGQAYGCLGCLAATVLALGVLLCLLYLALGQWVPSPLEGID